MQSLSKGAASYVLASSDSKKEATSYLTVVSEFEFITGIVSLYRLLHPLAERTQKLQGGTMEVVAAYTQVQSCISDIEHTRESIEEEYQQIFKHSECLAAKLVYNRLFRELWRGKATATIFQPIVCKPTTYVPWLSLSLTL